MSTYFYLYKLEDLLSGEFYFGSRKSKKQPSEDDYMGSMKTWKPDRSKLNKTILREDFETYKELIEAETEIIRKHIKNPLNRNNSIPVAPFHIVNKDDVTGENNGFYGKHHTEEHKKKVSEKLKGDKNPSFGKKWIHKDKIQKYVRKEEVDKLLSEGWILGLLMSENAFSCKRIWITNGKENKYLKETEIVIPEGWRKGKTYSEKAKDRFKDILKNVSKKGREASAKRLAGTIFITNGHENLRLTPEDAKSYLENGWRRGRWQSAWNKKRNV